MPTAMERSFNILTVDLEEWFVVDALADRFGREKWPTLTSTVEKNSYNLLRMFDSSGVRATWFVLGWVADRFPDLLKSVAEAGHEIACHSYYHRRVDTLDAETFRADTRKAIEAIFNATGHRPVGYRAPSWSLNQSVPWAFEILAELGFEYDSSIFPIKHDIYGVPGGPRQLFKMKFDSGRTLYELPATTFRLWGKNMPLAGGGYFRHSPYWFSRRLIRKLNSQGQPAVAYCHPWEIDPDPPRVEGLSFLQKFRSYSATWLFQRKLQRLLYDFNFITVNEYIRLRKRRKIGFQRP